MSPLLHRRLSDESLGSRLASGEAAAFDELYRRYVHRLAAYGAQLLGDAASGDDVAQAALMKAYGALRAGRVPDRIRPWLYRIAHNAAIDLVARRRELLAAELPDVAAGEPAVGTGTLVAALGSLPDRQRRVYVLRELHGLRIDETAAELGLTTAQVEQSLFAARNRLAEQLVFGERLSCVAVQRLAAGTLDAAERRALKTHLRSCPGCRSAVGRRGIALTLLPSLDWIRALAGWAAAPAAAKVGAAVATVTVAATVPLASRELRDVPHPHAPARAPVATHARPRAQIVDRASVPVHAAIVQQAPVAVSPPRAVTPTAHERERTRSDDRATPEHHTSDTSEQATSRDDAGGGDSHIGPAVTTPTPVASTKVESTRDDGAGESSGDARLPGDE